MEETAFVLVEQFNFVNSWGMNLFLCFYKWILLFLSVEKARGMRNGSFMLVLWWERNKSHFFFIWRQIEDIKEFFFSKISSHLFHRVFFNVLDVLRSKYYGPRTATNREDGFSGIFSLHSPIWYVIFFLKRTCEFLVARSTTFKEGKSDCLCFLPYLSNKSRKMISIL